MSGPNAAASTSSNPSTPSSERPPLTFEFTKRKRWADLLITELADAIILILSPSFKILFCGTAVTEILGWSDHELIDSDLIDLIPLDDQNSFRSSFGESIQTSTELLSYVRLNTKALDYHAGSKNILFEIKGRAHFAPDPDHEQAQCKCIFAVAKPYPGRNTAMLNTFLELKIENERLQQRVMELRAHSAPQTPIAATGPSSVYTTTSMPSARMIPPAPSAIPSQPPTIYSPPAHPPPGHVAYGDVMTSSVRGNFDGTNPYRGSLYQSASNSLPPGFEDEPPDDGSKKKKLKRLQSSEQYVCVTCGRTDSPEWRKGPLGPKTLCNACGLRWAKVQAKGPG